MAGRNILMRFRGRCWWQRQSDKFFKKFLHGRIRARSTVLCNTARLQDDITAMDFPTSNEVSEIWNYSKYGD